MRNIFLKLILSAVCIVPLTTGCAFNTLREINDSAYDISEYQFFDTEDGLFRFGTEPILAFAEGDSMSDYEYTFTTGKKDCLIGVMSLPYYHQTAEGFGEGLILDYQELYDNAEGGTTEYNGIPAYRITYSTSGVKYISIMLQYGNGDLFIVNMTESAEDNDVEKIAEKIIDTIEYKGERLKTASEEYECDYFTLTVPPELYVTKDNEEGVTLGLNLQNTTSDIGVRYSLNAVPDEDSIRELANQRFSKVSDSDGLNTYDCTTEVTEFLGTDAFVVKYTREYMGYETKWCHYYFEINGMCYEQLSSVTDDYMDEFQKMTDKINESIKFK